MSVLGICVYESFSQNKIKMEKGSILLDTVASSQCYVRRWVTKTFYHLLLRYFCSLILKHIFFEKMY